MDLSQREQISPIKWENVLLYGQNLIGRSLIRRAWLATSQYFAPTLTKLEAEERTLTSDVTDQREQLLAFP